MDLGLMDALLVALLIGMVLMAIFPPGWRL
ncbi:MAG: hypothetical protein RLZZ403_237 [Pseudomonadota bacterium]|jgi:hypothetical protein